jgi:hypothetical protein
MGGILGRSWRGSLVELLEILLVWKALESGWYCDHAHPRNWMSQFFAMVIIKGRMGSWRLMAYQLCWEPPNALVRSKHRYL